MLFAALLLLINDLSNTASAGGHASDWLLAIHYNALAGHLHGRLSIRLILWYFESWKSRSWKSQTVLAIDQTSNWSLAIHLVLGRVSRLLN